MRLINNLDKECCADPRGSTSPLRCLATTPTPTNLDNPSALTTTLLILHQAQARQGLVPDLLITFPAEHGPASIQLAELKCLNAGKSWYNSKEKAVDKKAKQIPKLYLDKAKTIDQKYCNTRPGQVGPLQQRLQSFGELQCIVAGQYGEVSQHTHDLLRKLTACKANHISHMEGRVLSDQERSILLQQLRRQLSVSIITAQSNCLLSRLNHMSPHAKEAAQRRANTKSREELLRKDREYHFEAFLRGKRLKHIGVLHL